MAWYDIINLGKPKPAAQGMLKSYAPNKAVGVTLTGGAAATYGDKVEILSDANNTSDCWVDGIYTSTANTVAAVMSVALTREAAGAGAPAAIECEVPFVVNTTVAADYHETIPISPPVYFPSGTGIRAACMDVATGGKTCKIHVTFRRNL